MQLNKLTYYFLFLLLVTSCTTTSKKPEEISKDVVPHDKDKNLLERQYEGFTLWLDCKERAPVKFRYIARKDTGDEPREAKFTFDPDVSKDCQQTSTNAYGKNYDRGHQVPANHMDFSSVAIKQSNYMTNILPQAAGMNRGAWLLTEEIVECYRDIDELLVLGGVIWGNNSEDDYFVDSHGVRTPDAYWKVIVRENKDVIAWIIPNSPEAKRKNLDEYLTTVANIEKITGDKIPVATEAKTKKLNKSWLIPVGCKKG